MERADSDIDIGPVFVHDDETVRDWPGRFYGDDDMICITMILEDMSMCARMISDNTGRYFAVDIQEGLEGRSTTMHLNDAQMGAVLALAIAGDEILPEDVTRGLYRIAEPVMPAENCLRLIP